MIYQTKGTCSKEIRLDVQNGVIRSVEFVLGCPGFTQETVPAAGQGPRPSDRWAPITM